MTSYIEHRISDQPQWTKEALEKLVPPWAITPRRSLHLTAREVDPTRGGHGQPNRRFPLMTAAQKRKERTLGSGPNILEAQAGAWGRCCAVVWWSQSRHIWLYASASRHQGPHPSSNVWSQVKSEPVSCSANNWQACWTFWRRSSVAIVGFGRV